MLPFQSLIASIILVLCYLHARTLASPAPSGRGQRNADVNTRARSTKERLRVPQTARPSRAQDEVSAYQYGLSQQHHGSGGSYDSSFHTSEAPFEYNSPNVEELNTLSHPQFSSPTALSSSLSNLSQGFTTMNLLDRFDQGSRVEEPSSSSSSSFSHMGRIRGHSVDFHVSDFHRANYVEPNAENYQQAVANHQYHVSLDKESGQIPGQSEQSHGQEIPGLPDPDEPTFVLRPSSLVYAVRSEDTKADYLEIVSKYRGLRKDYAEEGLLKKLTKVLENGLISRDRGRISDALLTLFPEIVVYPTWSNGIADEYCDNLVEDLSFITGQSKIDVRAFLFEAQIGSDTTVWLLQHGCYGMISFARLHGLGEDSSVVGPYGEMLRQRNKVPKDDRWKYKATQSETRQAKDLIACTTPKGDSYIYRTLNAPRIPLGFALVLTTAHNQSPSRFQQLLHVFYDRMQKPSWYDHYLESILRTRQGQHNRE
jgi:hypothetical protein